VVQIVRTITAKEDLFNAFHYSIANVPKIKAYQNFIVSFSSLFTAANNNIERSNRIVDWKNKKIKYENFIKSKTNESRNNIEEAMILFDEFLEDLTISGLYSLVEEIAIIDEGEDETVV
jgi:hypothetical protein